MTPRSCGNDDREGPVARPMDTRTRLLVLIPLFAAAMAAAARLAVPFYPVPLTLQTLVVLLSGALLGVAGGGAMALYLLLGFFGLPIFSGGGGPHYALSPTFGYLLAFPTAAAVVGILLAPRPSGAGEPLPPEPNRFRLALALLAGTAVIYAIGVPWLWWNLASVQHKTLTLWQALMAGMLPFLPGDLAKGALAYILIPPLRRALDR
jgi:biotin transport system substrate-specific component